MDMLLIAITLVSNPAQSLPFATKVEVVAALPYNDCLGISGGLNAAARKIADPAQPTRMYYCVPHLK